MLREVELVLVRPQSHFGSVTCVRVITKILKLAY